MYRLFTHRTFLSPQSRPWTTTRKVALVGFFAQLFFYIPVLTPYLQARGLSLAQINSLQALLIGAGLLLDVPTGILADRIGRRRSYTLGLACQVLAESTFLVARDYGAFALAQVFAGVGYALASGSVDALVYESLPAEGRPAAMQRAKGTIGAVYQFANLVAYVAGGFLVADLRIAHITTAMELTVLAMFLAFVGSFSIREASWGMEGRRRGVGAFAREGLSLLRRSPPLRRVALVYLLTNAFPVYLLVLYQPYLLRAGVAGWWLGVALGLGSVLALLGQRYAYRVEAALGMRRAVLLTTAAPGVLYLLMAVIGQPLLAVLLFCAQWGIIPAKEPLFSSYLNAHIPDAQRATVLSLVNTSLSVYVGLMGPVIGWVADASLPVAFLTMGLLVLGGALALRIDERMVGGDPL